MSETGSAATRYAATGDALCAPGKPDRLTSRFPSKALRLQGGFSLVELLVVLVIMTLLAAIFPFALQQMLPGRRLTASRETLIANLRELQSRAIASGSTTELLVEKSGYRMRTGRSAKELQVLLPAGIEMGLGIDRVEFFEDGSSTGGRIELRNDKRASGVTISRVTGRISAD